MVKLDNANVTIEVADGTLTAHTNKITIETEQCKCGCAWNFLEVPHKDKIVVTFEIAGTYRMQTKNITPTTHSVAVPLNSAVTVEEIEHARIKSNAPKNATVEIQNKEVIFTWQN